MRNLKPKHQRVLDTIKDYPQGLLLSQIQKFVGIKNKQLTLYYLNYLIQKEYLEKRSGLYFAKPHAGSAIPFTLPTQRPHAFRASAQLYKSHLTQAKAKMEAIGLHPEEKMKARRY